MVSLCAGALASSCDAPSSAAKKKKLTPAPPPPRAPSERKSKLREAQAEVKREIEAYRAQREARLRAPQPGAAALDARIARVTAEVDQAIAGLEAEYQANKGLAIETILKVRPWEGALRPCQGPPGTPPGSLRHPFCLRRPLTSPPPSPHLSSRAARHVVRQESFREQQVEV